MQELDMAAWEILFGSPTTALPSVIPDGSYSGQYACDAACCSGESLASSLTFSPTRLLAWLLSAHLATHSHYAAL
jgi:hypothetical protein